MILFGNSEGLGVEGLLDVIYAMAPNMIKSIVVTDKVNAESRICMCFPSTNEVA